MLRSRGEQKMPANARTRWQDVDKSEIPVTQLVRSFLMYQEDQNQRIGSNLLAKLLAW
jgi:hypothetical protein